MEHICAYSSDKDEHNKSQDPFKESSMVASEEEEQKGAQGQEIYMSDEKDVSKHV